MGKSKHRNRSLTALTIDDLEVTPDVEKERAQGSQRIKRSWLWRKGGTQNEEEDGGEVEDLNSRDFPVGLASEAGVFNPNSQYRFYWDMTVLMLMLYLLYVTPFELAFVQRVPQLGTLWSINLVVDVGFLLDIVITVNTAVFDSRRHVWIIDRKLIFKQYAKVWLWIDFITLFRWEPVLKGVLPSAGSYLQFIKLIRLVRLVRLIRLLKAPAMMARIQQRISVSFKTQLVTKYFLALISLLHIEACAIRIAHDLLTKDRDNLDVSTYLATRHRLYRPKFRNGNFYVYIDALDWAFQTLLGQSMYTNTTEGIMSIINNFIGVVFLSFLIGDIANIMCNLDPAKNEYKQTVDMLNNYMAEHNFPERMRQQLRLYLSHSEDLFRARFHDNLIQRLSPPLQELVAHFMLGSQVMRAPFFAYAKAVTLRLVVNRRVYVKSAPGQPRSGRIGDAAKSITDKVVPVARAISKAASVANLGDQRASPETSPDRHGVDGRPEDCKFDVEDVGGEPSSEDDVTVDMEPARALRHGVRIARIIRVAANYNSVDVEYDDDETEELDVPMSRLALENEPIGIQRAFENLDYCMKLVVTQFARAMKMNLYNGGDFLTRKDVSHTDRMFIVDRGDVVAFGEDVARPIRINYYREHDCMASGQLAILAAGHRARLAWYNARALVMTRVLILNADDFLDILSMPGYEDFYKCVARYGRWYSFKLAFWTALRDGSLASRLAGTYVEPVTNTSDARDYAKEAIMSGAASSLYERLLAAKIASEAQRTEKLLHKTNKRLDHLEAKLDRLCDALLHATGPSALSSPASAAVCPPEPLPSSAEGDVSEDDDDAGLRFGCGGSFSSR